MTRPPQRVMRFYDVQYALESIALKQITFLHMDKLNDPFDPYIFFETNFNRDYQALINHAQQHHTEDIQEFKNKLPKEKWEGFIEDMESRSNNFRKSVFIFSTSEIGEDNHPKDNLYMWSHYGDGHKGVAIEFDTALLTRSVLEEHKKLGGAEADINNPWVEIKYLNEIPKITCEHIVNFVINDTPIKSGKAWMKTELANFLSELPSYKSMEWKIEKEWRLMWHDYETRLKIKRLDLLDDTITAVFLGFRYPPICDPLNDDIIIETKRHFPRAEIFKARKGKGKSLLDFERIAAPANTKT